MFDIFGLDEERKQKASIEGMARGMTLGMIEAFEMRLEEKDRQIQKLSAKIAELTNE